MTAVAIPPWCQWQDAASPLLIVAPHGGRRRRGRRLADGTAPKVNDLHTADVARALAERLDASFIINVAFDRNELDLNRISQVLRSAPWFLHLVERALDRILARHAVAEIVFIHGWNVTQARCDIGVGVSMASEDDAAHQREGLTVSPAYLADRLASLRAACAGDGVLATYGERYPARHPNNVLQLFRRVPARTRDASLTRLAAWAAADRVHAVQIELGVPLRWPGPHRDRFLATATRIFAVPWGGEQTDAADRVAGRAAATPPGAGALQFYDPRADLGIIAGVGTRGDQVSGARLLLLVGPRRIALFTGEGRAAATVHGAPRFEQEPTGFRLRFEGAMLRLDDGRLYIDLETALAASILSPATVDLQFAPGPDASYGRVTGTVRLDDRTFAVDTYGFADPRLALRRVGTRSRQTTLSAAFGDAGAVVVRFGDEQDAGVLTRIAAAGASSTPLSAMTVHFDGDALAPERFVLNPANAPAVVARVASRMAIEQPAGPGHYARITFGVARFTLDGRTEGAGFYEYARRIARRGPGPGSTP